MAKLVDALPWGGSARKGMEVQILSRAQIQKSRFRATFLYLCPKQAPACLRERIWKAWWCFGFAKPPRCTAPVRRKSTIWRAEAMPKLCEVPSRVRKRACAAFSRPFEISSEKSKRCTDSVRIASTYERSELVTCDQILLLSTFLVFPYLCSDFSWDWKILFCPQIYFD